MTRLRRRDPVNQTVCVTNYHPFIFICVSYFLVFLSSTVFFIFPRFLQILPEVFHEKVSCRLYFKKPGQKLSISIRKLLVIDLQYL